MRNFRNLVLSLPLILAFSMYMFGQAGGSGGGAGSGSAGHTAQGSGGTGSSAPGTDQGASDNSGSANAPQPVGGVHGAATAGAHANKSLKGCVQQSGSAYMLQENNGKTAMLSGQDLSSYVGQEVKVHGSFEKGGTTAATAGAGFGGATGSAGNSSSQGNNSANASAGVSGSGMATNASAPAGQATASSATDHPDENFVVSKVEKVSGQCKNAGGSSGSTH